MKKMVTLCGMLTIGVWGSENMYQYSYQQQYNEAQGNKQMKQYRHRKQDGSDSASGQQKQHRYGQNGGGQRRGAGRH